jgi:hypothetical protein
VKQAPSDFPEFASFVVQCGIGSVSLNADTVIETTLRLAATERQLDSTTAAAAAASAGARAPTAAVAK